MSPTTAGMLWRTAARKLVDWTCDPHACTRTIRHLMIWPLCAAVTMLLTYAAVTMLLTWAAPAQAAPCSQWGFPGGRFLFTQSNGYTVELSSPSGQDAQSRALAWNNSGDELYGRSGGNINGYHINFDVQWTNGHIGKYQGGMDPNGFAHGSTVDLKDPNSTASWDSVAALRCIS